MMILLLTKKPGHASTACLIAGLTSVEMNTVCDDFLMKVF